MATSHCCTTIASAAATSRIVPNVSLSSANGRSLLAKSIELMCSPACNRVHDCLSRRRRRHGHWFAGFSWVEISVCYVKNRRSSCNHTYHADSCHRHKTCTTRARPLCVANQLKFPLIRVQCIKGLTLNRTVLLLVLSILGLYHTDNKGRPRTLAAAQQSAVTLPGTVYYE